MGLAIPLVFGSGLLRRLPLSSTSTGDRASLCRGLLRQWSPRNRRKEPWYEVDPGRAVGRGCRALHLCRAVNFLGTNGRRAPSMNAAGPSLSRLYSFLTKAYQSKSG
jgi:hypothetical protein